VFDALFDDYDFAEHNPVSKVMQSIVATLHDQALESETERLEGFYESVRMRGRHRQRRRQTPHRRRALREVLP
jgi:predicted helicase